MKLIIPEINLSQTIELKPNEKINFNNKEIEQLYVNTIESGYLHPLGFNSKDYNGDGKEELCATARLLFSSSMYIPGGNAYFFYQVENNAVLLKKCIYMPFYTESDAENTILNYVFEHILWQNRVQFNENGIIDPQYLTEYAGEDVNKAINRMIEMGWIKCVGNTIYFDF